VQNGLDAEEGLEKSINQASKKGVKIFTASNYVQVRKTKEANPHGHGAGDPHFWLDPISMKAVVNGLSESIKKEFNIDVSQNALVMSKKLDDLSAGILTQTAVIPEQNRKLVTGHDSLGYYAARYNFTVIGAVIPSFATGAQASAAQVSKLEKLIKASKVPAIFAEIGTPKQVVNVISKDTGAKVVELTDHILPSDGSYYTMMNNMTATIVEALK
ncbi:MAG: zinc transporter ZnuA, partial [Pseudomonadota bacterium]